MNKKWMAVLAAALMMLVGTATTAQAVTTWNQGFEKDTAGWLDSSNGWYGSIDRVKSGTAGITAASGHYYAKVNGDADSAPFSRFAGYSDTWEGPWMAEISVYLDPDAFQAGEGFDYSVAASGSDGDHQRDFIFHVTKDSSTGSLLVAGSNNSNFAPREDLENLNHYVVTDAGWYTLQHSFQENNGVLAVGLNVLTSDGAVEFTETRTSAADTIPAEVGGNRYSWFTFATVPNLAVDDHKAYQVLAKPVTKDDCRDGGWESFGFKNQGQCIASVQANENAGQ